MRMLSLAAFAVLALALGAFKEDGMTLLIGVASALAAVASLPRWRMSTFLTLLCDLFAIETVLFGLADLVALTGYWPQSLEMTTSCRPICRWRQRFSSSPFSPSPIFAWSAG